MSQFYLFYFAAYFEKITTINFQFRIVIGWWNSRKMISRRRSSRQDRRMIEDTKTRKQWVEDYKLVSYGPQALFPEYLEMGME